MSTFKTETEQVDDLKRWVKSYGPSIVVGILLALVIIYGKQFWQKHQTQKAEQASELYQQLSDAYTNQKTDLITETTNTLKQKFTHSPYAQYAALMHAKTSVEKQDYTQATSDLNWVIKNAKDSNLQYIAILRLARVQLANNDANKAIATLKQLDNTAYKGLAKIIQGDALLSLNKPKEAKTAYQTALTEIPDAIDVMPTIQIRIDNIGELNNA